MSIIELVTSLGPEPDLNSAAVAAVPLAWVRAYGGINDPWLTFLVPQDDRITDYEISVGIGQPSGYQAVDTAAYGGISNWESEDQVREATAWILSSLMAVHPEQLEGQKLYFRVAALPQQGVGLQPSFYEMPGYVQVDFAPGKDVAVSASKEVDWGDYTQEELEDAGLGGRLSVMAADTAAREGWTLHRPCGRGYRGRGGLVGAV